MKELNITATTSEEQRIKAYLEENASDTLRDKIENGVPYEKDGVILTNRKTLSGFMEYACEEARKQAEKAPALPVSKTKWYSAGRSTISRRTVS